MSTSYSDKIVMSVGGSLIVPNGGINIEFLSRLNSFIRNQLAKFPNRQFFLVTGGGSTARHYIDAGKAIIGELTNNDLDWLGIHATRFNAHLVRTIFHDIAHPVILEHYESIRKVEEPVVVGAGWKPGWSTDYCAVMVCDDYGARTIVNMSNIDKVFDKDPKQFPEAKPIDHISWAEFRTMVGDTWTPGLNMPFDPIASKKAEELGVKVVVLNGNNFDNLEEYFAGRDFVGTIIS